MNDFTYLERVFNSCTEKITNMNNLNAFYKIGTIGLILTAALHILFAVVFLIPSVHTSFAIVYPSWIAFLVIGSTQMAREKKKR